MGREKKEKKSKKEDGSIVGPEIAADEISLHKLLGKGCFGEVWKATLHKTEVAVKIPLVQSLDPEELEALRTECHIMSTHSHENICMFMGACTKEGEFRIVTELLDGDVENLIHDSKLASKLTPYHRLLLAKDAAKGMIWLHKIQPPIIHRDLKPANLLVKKLGEFEYRVKVTDFGLSAVKPKRAKKLRDLDGGAKGTPLYMAPEVMLNMPFDEKADVFSFGILLWEIMTSQDPFADHEDYDVFVNAVAKLGERPPIPSNMPKNVRQLMESCWEHQAKKRPGFDIINDQLDQCLIEAAIDDKEGQRFWRHCFLNNHKPAIGMVIRTMLSYMGMDSVPTHGGDAGVPGGGASYESIDWDGNGTGLISSSGAATSRNKGGLDYARIIKAALLGDDSLPDTRTIHITEFGKVLKWYYPFSRNSDWIHTTIDLMSKPWFFGPSSATRAESALAGAPEGSFLIRFSGTPGAYTIVRKHAGGIGHIRVMPHKKGYELSRQVFPTLDKLISTVSTHLGLLYPCPGSPFIKLTAKGSRSSTSAYEAF